ncbi:MAG: Asp/Glu/hydantoin racemase, partial [Hungatella sp.]
DFADYSGVPIVRIDQEMCREAVRLGSRIAIMATLPTTLQPTKNTVMRMARSIGRVVTPVVVFVDGALVSIRKNFGCGCSKKQERLQHKSM